MTPSATALLGSLAVVALAVGVVQPVALGPKRRPRALADLPRRSLSPVPCPARFAAAVHDAGLDGAPSTWFTGTLVVLATVVTLGVFAGGPVFGVLVGAIASGVAFAGLRSLAGRREALLVRSIPDSLDAIARATRAGASVVQALEALDRPDATPADRLMATIARQAAHGEALGEALARSVASHPTPAVRLALAALAVGHETGAPPARAVEGVAATLRDRAALDREAKAHASQARASAWVLVVAPVAFSLFAIATDPRVGQFLFRSPIGWFCLVLGVTLDSLGAWWMRSIMAAAR